MGLVAGYDQGGVRWWVGLAAAMVTAATTAGTDQDHANHNAHDDGDEHTHAPLHQGVLVRVQCIMDRVVQVVDVVVDVIDVIIQNIWSEK